jgi:hypothetical protein
MSNSNITKSVEHAFWDNTYLILTQMNARNVLKDLFAGEPTLLYQRFPTQPGLEKTASICLLAALLGT